MEHRLSVFTRGWAAAFFEHHGTRRSHERHKSLSPGFFALFHSPSETVVMGG
jgi:hypothetical protein